MKKILLFLFLFIPFYVSATVENYYMEATVLKNGDISVKEVFSLDGSYNGFNRELYYGNNIYGGSGIEIVSVRGISESKLDGFNTLNATGDLFKLVGSASSGDYGYYSVSNISRGINVKIYNPSRYNKMFYLEYIVKNMAIKHNDVGEVGYNIFTSLNEPVDNLNVKFVVPNNKNIRVWAHGPLEGETSIVSSEVVLLKLDYLYAYEAVDIRITFDRNILSDSLKIDDNNVLDSIIAEETKKADAANAERENQRKALEKLKAEIEDAIIAFEKDRTQANKDYALSLVNKLYGMEEYYVYFERINNTLSYEEENAIKRKEIICNIVITLGVCYLGFGFYLVYKFYNKNDKEYKSAFDNKYYRDFPASYGPEIVEYLIKKNVTEDSFSASLLNLIYKKNIGYESIDKKDYKLTLLSEDNLTTAEKRLVLCVFDNDKEMTLKKLKKNAKSSYDSFIRRYNTWKDEVIYEAKNYNFFEKANIVPYILYSSLGFILMYFLINLVRNSFGYLITFTVFLFSFISIFYYACSFKRSKNGNEDYHKWMGLKNFMKDFGRMHEKELPEIILWEKYLVYASIFGLAKKLAKDMEIRVQEMQNIDTTDIIRFNMINSMLKTSSVVASTIGEVKRTADRAYSAAHSSDSSGGGFGGGFSSGGGSFGGGGGGGRF